jgi:hypothetical protein
MTDEVSVKVPVEFREPMVNMESALRNFLEAGRKLSEVWDNDKVKNILSICLHLTNFFRISLEF